MPVRTSTTNKWLPRFGYAATEIGTVIVFSMISSYLSIYYTDAVGLVPSVVSVLMLIVRLIQSIGAPIAGSIIDHTRSKYGRCRPWLVWGLVPLVVFSILTFTTIKGNNTVKALWAGLTYILLGMAYTLVDTAKGSLVNTITADGNERIVLNSWRSMGSSIIQLVLSAITMPMILFFGNGSRGYFITNLIFAIVTVPIMVFAFFACKETVVVPQNAPKVTVKDSLTSITRNPQLLWFVLFNFVATGAALWRVGVMTYYYMYSLGRPDLVAVMMSCFSAGQFIPPLVVPFLLKRFGKKGVLIGSTMIQGVLLLIMHVTPFNNVVLIGILTFLFGAFMMGSLVGFSTASDCIEYDYYRNGRRMPGTVVGAVTLSVQAGMAIGGALGVFLLGVFGYHKGVPMTLGMRTNISMVVNLIPGLIMICSTLLLIPYKLSNKRMKKIQAANEARDKKIAAQSAAAASDHQ